MRNLYRETFKHMTAVPKSFYIQMLDGKDVDSKLEIILE